jgi:cold shock protein
MTMGTVRWFNIRRGFGYIEPDGGGKDVYVAASALVAAGMAPLAEGQKVSFDETNCGLAGKLAARNLRAS